MIIIIDIQDNKGNSERSLPLTEVPAAVNSVNPVSAAVAQSPPAATIASSSAQKTYRITSGAAAAGKGRYYLCDAAKYYCRDSFVSQSLAKSGMDLMKSFFFNIIIMFNGF